MKGPRVFKSRMNPREAQEEEVRLFLYSCSGLSSSRCMGGGRGGGGGVGGSGATEAREDGTE